MMMNTSLRCLAAALALAGGCLGAQAAGTLTYCTDGAPDGFDPAQFETIPTDNAAGRTLYDQLLSMKPGTTEVAPGAVERWETSADGRTVTLHLRHGVKFHTTPWFKPTREMNADDVMWSLDRLADPKHPGHAIAANGYPYWASMNMSALIKAITKVDTMTVRIDLAHADSSFLADLTLSAIGSVMSAEYADQLQKAGKLGQINTQPIGTGPFVFRSYQKDAVVRYGPNPDYWGGAPKLAQLVFAVSVDAGVRAQRVKAGECLVAPVAADQMASLQADPRITIMRSQPLMTSYVAPNAKHLGLGDKRLREALSLAIDRTALVKAGYGGLAEPAGSFLPPSMWSHDVTIVNAHDPERARALVKASGYDGHELLLFTLAADNKAKEMAELMQSDWASVGIKVSLRSMELGELYKRTGQGEHDLALLAWYSDNGDPDNFLAPNLECVAVDGGGNKSRYCNPAFDALLAAARAATDIKSRSASYVKAQLLLHDDTGLIPLAHKMLPYAVSRRVTGFIATPFGGVDFRNASVN